MWRIEKTENKKIARGLLEGNNSTAGKADGQEIICANHKKHKKQIIAQCILGYIWITYLKDTDSYYSIYLLIAFLGSLAMWDNYRHERGLSFWKEKIPFAFAVMFSMAVFAADYGISLKTNYIKNAPFLFPVLYKLLYFMAIISGGVFLMFHLLVWITAKQEHFQWAQYDDRKKSCQIFGISLLCIVGVYLFLFLSCYYPGNLSPDSMNQIRQCLMGQFTNHHPVFHTFLINACIKMGMVLNGNIEAGVVLYLLFQILVMGSIFSYTVLTLYQMKLRRYLMIAVLVYYAAFPLHVMYSFTMWKDVLFGGSVLLFTVAYGRILFGIGRKHWNFMCLVIGGIGMCLLRSNGWAAFLLTVLAYGVLSIKDRIQRCGSENANHSDRNGVLICLLGILALSSLMKFPLLDALHIPGPNIYESLSIPAQQVARTIRDCDDLTEKQEALLEKIVDVEAVPETYKNYISDSIKGLLRKTDDGSYLKKHRWDYLKLYLEVGAAHPKKYLEAWIDQTKGYWNGGYAYWRWSDTIVSNDFGLERKVGSKAVRKLFRDYMWLFENVPLFQPLVGIGLHVWLVCLVGFINLVRRERGKLFLTIPVLAVVVTLLIAAPVYAECRYAYAVFCVIPFLGAAAFYERNTGQTVLERKDR